MASLLALKCEKFPCLWGVTWGFRQPLLLVVMVVSCYFGVFYVTVGMSSGSTLLWGWWVCLTSILVSVLECFSCLLFLCASSDWELVWLVLLVVLKCNAEICILQWFDALHRNCCNWYNWFYRSYLDLMLVYVILGLFNTLLKTVMIIPASFVGCTAVYCLTLWLL